RKPTTYTLMPAVFMVVTTIGALAWQAYRFFTAPQPNWFLGSAALLLIGLAMFVGLEALQALKVRKLRPETVTSEA
ncbi:MAG: carbon starvation protein A, partial [Nitrospinaceae bacterium]|nr:carbon starvation protein A [Nitrospinaceae bacterium]NIR53712.1 carbon starvation protein A [Nitrospinaceae bacterium]NIS84120.1 carbon starvation protein A [Nitrospinaceae bacterium]NIT80921.1 carbon starvation protein A [Nitrospinaceae bacterium]NIU43219.1 carbon starvation protein A [Nitrospinaceae bacterium]